MTTDFSEPEDMSLWNCMVLNGIFMFLFNEESRKCSVPIVQNYNKNQFCAHKQIRNKPFRKYKLAAMVKTRDLFVGLRYGLEIMFIVQSLKSKSLEITNIPKSTNPADSGTAQS